jgi:hypothetical protein
VPVAGRVRLRQFVPLQVSARGFEQALGRLALADEERMRRRLPAVPAAERVEHGESCRSSAVTIGRQHGQSGLEKVKTDRRLARSAWMMARRS